MNQVDDTHNRLGNRNQPSATAETPNLLCLVFDCNPYFWSTGALKFEEVAKAFAVFMNAHLAMSSFNRVAVVAAHPNWARMIYPVSGEVDHKVHIRNGTTMYRTFREMDEVVLSSLKEILKQPIENQSADPQSAISGALSIALSYISKSAQNDEASVNHHGARILLATVSSHLASQYIPTMNSIFAAQKMKVPIDICQLGGTTEFLQQAADSTDGVYMRVSHVDGLIQYLMSAFAVEPSLREFINVPKERDVDFRAACFVTKQVVDIGYVCSVCLCIMSTIYPSCPMCGSEYSADVLANLKKVPVVKVKSKKKKKAIAGNSVGTSAVASPGTPSTSAPE